MGIDLTHLNVGGGPERCPMGLMSGPLLVDGSRCRGGGGGTWGRNAEAMETGGGGGAVDTGGTKVGMEVGGEDVFRLVHHGLAALKGLSKKLRLANSLKGKSVGHLVFRSRLIYEKEKKKDFKK